MKKVLIIILGILLVGTGMSLVVRPIEAFAMLGYIMGAVLLVNGIANVIIWFQTRKVQKISAWYLISAVLSIVFALVVFGDVFFKIAFETFLLYIVAFWFFVTGILRIVFAFKIRRMYKEENDMTGKNWWIFLILGILLIICGVMSFANPFILVIAIGLNLGINMMFCGIDLITLATVV